MLIRMIRHLFICAAACFCAPAFAGELQRYAPSRTYEVPAIREPDCGAPVANVIYMIGDGMGLNQVGIAWAANRGRLFIENCPVIGVSATWCADRLVTDSAAAGTALATGEKTLYRRISMTPDGKELSSLADKAADLGKSTGLVVTCELNDATPAAFFAHSPVRSEAHLISGQLPGSRFEFVFGGGGRHFTGRPDGRDIFREMADRGYQVARSWAEAAEFPAGKTLCVADAGNLPRPEERGDALRLAAMKAIDVLSRNPKGFFLMIEGSKIDKAAHGNKLDEMVEETLDFDRAVGAVLEWASRHPGTLVVVTADHCTGGAALLDGSLEKGEVAVSFSTKGHDGVTVPVYAFGAGSRAFSGFYDNTEVARKIGKAMEEASARTRAN